MKQKLPVIIDCDPGHDDAIMLMLAFGSQRFDVKAVTVSAGNQTQERTLDNTLRILSFIGARANVYGGCSKPLLHDLKLLDEIHGKTGLGGVILPDPVLAVKPQPAAEAIAGILKNESEKLTLVVTGPLTNIATFLSLYPALKNKVEKIVLMGGGIFRGNVTPTAEFNIHADPEAAAIVFTSGIPLVMFGLDVTHKALLYDKDISDLANLGTESARLAAKLMQYYAVFYKKNRPELNGGTALHDPCPVAWLIDPSIFSSKKCNVEVELSGRFTTGMTVVDFYDTLKKERNTEVVYDLNRDQFLNMLYKALKNLP